MTSPFIKPDLPRAATSAWLVHQVGSAVEIVHVGPTTPDVLIAIERIGSLFGAKAIALGGDIPEGFVGVRLEDSDQDQTWRALLGLSMENTKVDSARVLLGMNRVQYVALARQLGVK